MKTTSLHIAFAALLSLLLLASCSRNDEVSVAEGEEGKVYVTLTLSINGEEVGSRATWNSEQDTDEEGVGWENKIDDLQILIYDANNNYVGKVEDLIQLLDGRYSGTLSSDAEWTGNTNYKIMAFANCPSIDNPSNISTLDYTRANVSYIPMWGVTTAQFNLTPGVSEDIGSIDLLRAMAKVEVIMNAEGYTIDNIAVDKSNPNGYCLPNGYNSVSETDQLDMEGETPASFKPYTSETPESKAEDGQHYIYLPEYDNSTKPAKIQVTVNNETYELEFKDYENGVPTGAPYDIVRNHIYRYTITGVNDGKLIIKYKAMPWELVTSEIGYAPQPASTTVNPFVDDNDYDEFMKNGYILLPVDGFENKNIDNVPDKYNDRTTVRKLFRFLYDYPADFGDDDARYCILTKPTYDLNDDSHTTLKTGTAGARYFFMLTGPKGATWEAKLLNEDGTKSEDFTFSYTPEDDFSGSEYANEGSVNKVSHGIARQKPYIIQVNCVEAWTEGTSFTEETEWGKSHSESETLVQVKLYITVTTAEGATYNLEINPSYENNENKDNMGFLYRDYRRYAGEDDFVWIRQVPAQYEWSYEDLASPNKNEHQTERYWWQVNDYWK